MGYRIQPKPFIPTNTRIKTEKDTVTDKMAPSVSQAETLQAPPSSHFPGWGSSLNLQELQIQGASNDNQEVTYLFPDTIALESICDNQESQYEITSIRGFEIYIVEQWACERKYGTVITAFTGDSEHEIKVGKVNLPLDTSKWSDKLMHFFQEIAESGAKPKKTEEGFLFITNLSSFPSNLNLLPIPCGCVLDTWEYFKVNVNLRRMHCGGRSALLLCSPSDASGDKFRQIYKTHPKVDVMYAVKELVMLVQICLVDFKLLDPNFVDGLLCDKTVEKIKDWWRLFGSAYYGTTPKDGLLGPTTVAAILGFVLSCHFRLDIAGSDFPKEPFNYFSFRVNVGKFQKQYNLKRTWYLDPITVEKLFRVTTKISNTDISKLKKVVKSTVQDISGKGSSIQYAPEVLTLDLEKLIKYFHCSARLTYLWYGKGDIRDIKGFDYHERGIPASSLRSGVGKIRSLPRRLQDDNVSEKRAKERQSETCKEVEDEPQEQQLCQQLDERFKKQIMMKKKLTTDESFNNELRRRSSFPFIRNEISVGQIEYENLPISRVSNITTNTIMKRSKSFSFVENSLSRWDFIPSPCNFGDKVKSLKSKLYIHQHLTEKFNKVKNQYAKTVEKSHNELAKLNQMVKPINRQYEIQTQAGERAKMKMEDIQALSARLEYELRILSTRVRDTEDSVDQFVSKVQSLDKSISESNACLKFKSKDWDGHSENIDENNMMEICWYSIVSRFDVDRLKHLWMKFDPSFGYANWIRDKFFCSNEQQEQPLPKTTVSSYESKKQADNKNSFVNTEKAKQN